MASSDLWITLCKSGGQLLETNILPLVQGRPSIMGPLAASNFSGIRDSSHFPLVGNEKTIGEEQPRKSTLPRSSGGKGSTTEETMQNHVK